MGDFLAGLGIILLGFGFFQFSKLFGVYTAIPKKEGGIPWTFLVLRTIGFVVMLIGLVVLIIGLV
jgi:hypothetical protein